MSTYAGTIAVIGKPNAGKSTLLNAILGERISIVTHKAQTTRRTVLGISTRENYQSIFLDTPGFLKPKYQLQKAMLGYIERAVGDADILLIIIDASKLISEAESFDDEFYQYLKSINKPKILALNKLDLLDNRKKMLPLMDKAIKENIFDEVIPISALKKVSIHEVLKTIEKYLPESDFFYDPEYLSIQPEKFFVAELIRENIFNVFSQEIPYSTEVVINQFKEREKSKWYISAEIIVERNSQKQILIGHEGQMIKKIGELSRKRIEEHLQTDVYLELFVKVRDKWRNNNTLLKSYGYSV
ncbi:MAG TPA: GTPase Era [Candidatus Kapabacteria bacterium]|nr:GTPase Era [Candidatus Kapabacteria bacterium]HPO62520.1 GTPase Era [Candidatus Kapabacteria bacterium]